MENKVIITAALAARLSRIITLQHRIHPRSMLKKPRKPSTAGASMVHIHGRDETMGGYHTSEVDKVKAVYDAIKQNSPDLIIQVTSSVGFPARSDPSPSRIA